MFHAILTCNGLTSAEAANAPRDIVEEISHRPWHQNVECRSDSRLLRMEADNDYDADGKALLDEFGDAVVACVNVSGIIRFAIVSVESLPAGA